MVLRVLLVASVRNSLAGDASFFHAQANVLASGHGFINPLRYAVRHVTEQSAAHPPLFSLVLSLPSLVGLRTVLDHRLMCAVLDTGTIVLVALVARRLAGDEAGLAAAGLAAVSPTLLLADAALMSEALFALLIAAVLLCSYRFLDEPSWRRAMWLGATVGAAALTRGEGVLLIGLAAGLPVLAAGPRRRRLGWSAAAVATSALLIAPWTIYNATRFDRLVVLSTNGDFVQANSNCDTTWRGELIGYWSLRCNLAEVGREPDESVRAAAARRQGRVYVRRHLRRAPVVLAARLGRAFEVFRPVQGARFSDAVEGRPFRLAILAMAWSAVLVPFGVVGCVALIRRRVSILPLVAMAGLVAVTVLGAYGAVRFRVPLDVVLLVLAGTGLDHLIRSSPPSTPDGADVPAAASAALR